MRTNTKVGHIFYDDPVLDAPAKNIFKCRRKLDSYNKELLFREFRARQEPPIAEIIKEAEGELEEAYEFFDVTLMNYLTFDLELNAVNFYFPKEVHFGIRFSWDREYIECFHQKHEIEKEINKIILYGELFRGFRLKNVKPAKT